ncbi:hypothetical protein XENOCAPTIV_024742 [Xenoophorus captivus]|uniref:Uncharacterized protein n=1 Tax=Xenoophorus captivus TaxID=1517983 RepID=A0ABV0QEF0_9TELE
MSLWERCLGTGSRWAKRLISGVRLSIDVFVVPGFHPRHRRSLFILPQQYDCCLLDMRWGCGAEDRLNNPGTGLRPLGRKLNTGRNSSRSQSPRHIFLHSRPH